MSLFSNLFNNPQLNQNQNQVTRNNLFSNIHQAPENQGGLFNNNQGSLFNNNNNNNNSNGLFGANLFSFNNNNIN